MLEAIQLSHVITLLVDNCSREVGQEFKCLVNYSNKITLPNP